VTDPFGRSATLEYGLSGALLRITDVIGIVSQMEYGATDFVRALTTPYGTTTFSFGAPISTISLHPSYDRWLEAVDPLGGKERIEFRWTTAGIPTSESASAVPTGFINNVNLETRNSFYFDKRAMAFDPGDYTKAHMFHWLWESSLKAVGIMHSEKKPLENRVWYGQVGETMADAAGPDGRPAKIGRVLDDGTSQITRSERNARGKLTRSTDPGGRETIYVYGTGSTPDPDQANGAGIDLLQVKQKNGSNYDLISVSTYNAQHLPLTTTDASAQTTTYTYNAQGQVLTVTTPQRSCSGCAAENRTTSYFYTSAYLQSITGPATGATTSYTYDGYGRVRTTTDSDSYSLTYDYDALDRPTRTTYPDGTYEETAYNRLDRERTRDRLGRWTSIFYDALRREVATRDPLGRTATKQWCNCGSLDKLIDGNGNTTTWERDIQGRLTRELRPDNSAWDYTYENTTSRLSQVKDPKQQIKTYQYFLDDSLKQITYTNAQYPTPTVSFTYDTSHPRLATMTDGTGTTAFSYTPIAVPPALGAGRLSSVDGPFTNDTIAYSYDELGRLVGRGVNGISTTLSYDLLGRRASLVDPLGSFSYSYDTHSGRVTTVTYPGGRTTTLSYLGATGDHRLQEILNHLPGGATLSKYDYTYDAVGKIATWTQQVGANPAGVYTLGYDAADQLTTATITGLTPLPVPSRFGYAYDATGNRTAEQLDDAVMGATYNNRNELTSRQPGGALLFGGAVNEAATVTVGGKPAQVAPDNRFVGQAQAGAGNTNVVVAATDSSGNTRTNTYQVSESGSTSSYAYDAKGNLTSDGTRTFEWDAEDRLLAINQGTHRTEFNHDGQGRRTRIVEKENGLAVDDRRFVWCETQLCEERDSTGTTVTERSLEHGALDGGTPYLYGVDHEGSVRQMTDLTGAVRAEYDYDPWGRRTKVAGDKDAPFGFTGRFVHGATGLSLTLFRAYDANLGRWLSEDPIGQDGGPNLYRYADNDPINSVDPLGLYKKISGQTNCIGYATGVNTYIEPDPGQSVQQMLQQLGFKCTGPSSAKCECACEKPGFVLYVYSCASCPPGMDPFRDPWIPDEGKNDIHSIKAPKCPKQKPWTYVPGAGRPGTPGLTVPQNTPDPSDPDSYWTNLKKPVPKFRYCCCKE
jgi:RHS repeat-associated protein